MNSYSSSSLLCSRMTDIKFMRDLAIIAVACILTGCGKTQEAEQVATTSASSSESSSIENSVTLTPQEIDKLGITITPVQSITFTPEVEGYGVVLDHETIAQRTADVAAA